jgi:hypothetical protein
MEFKAQPGVIDIEFFLNVVDNALADITERSDIIGKYFEIDHNRLIPPLEKI